MLNRFKMKENWKSIKGYEDYEVSDLGNVRSLKNGKVRELKPGLGKRGYLLVALWKNAKSKTFYIHGLVIKAFKGPIPKGMVVNHLNEIKTDNRLSNLEVVTQKENLNYGGAQERKAKANSKELKLTHARSCAKYTFSNGCEASAFFGYKRKNTVGNYIFYARQRGKNWINILGEKYYFTQSA